MKKNTLFLLNGITLFIVIISIYFIIKNYIQAFDYSLFEIQRFIISQGILIRLLKKTIVSTVLMVTGLACIGLFLLSYESEKFLVYALLFFICSGFNITMWDRTIMFLSGRTVSGLWNRMGDIYLLIYLFLLFSLSVSKYKIVRQIHLYKINTIILIISSIAVIFLKPVKSNQITEIIGIYYCFLFMLMILYFIKKKVRVRTMDLVIMLTNCLIGIIASFGKLRTLSDIHSIYTNMLPFLMLAATLFFFLDFYQRHRTGILFGRENNRKLHELTRHKEKITELIIEYCQYPINMLKAMSVKLSKNYNNYAIQQSQLLDQMDHYIDEVNRYIKNIGEYSGIYSYSLEEYNIKINISILIKNALDSLDNENIKWDYNHFENMESLIENRIMGDPFQLIDANRKLLGFLYDYKKDKRLYIMTSLQEGFVKVELAVKYDVTKRRMIKSIVRRFSKKTFVSSIVEENLIPLSIAKQFIEHSKGTITLCLDGEYIRFIYYLPEIDEKSEAGNFTSEIEELNNYSYHIVLISTLPQQVELIEKYLMYENFHIKKFSSSAEALQYIENANNINVIIVGDMFDKIDALEICKEIRKEYSLEQMPILMISHEKNTTYKSDAFLYVNDIIYESFEYITLLQKLHSLIILQESVKESMLSRLDFLQAQMDPHFIFNTISTIMPLCIENPMQAYNLLGYFSEYLRGSLYHKGLNKTILLEQELELINAYLKIQNVRFNNSIHYTLINEVEPTIKILPLIIEPIVENSIKHGKIIGKELSIRVEIKKIPQGISEDDFNEISFVIEDNGKGISSHKLEEILQETDENNPKESHSIGISNLKKRLQIYYQSALRIESKEGKGTRISFTISSDAV